ncbi:hypothetical protein GCM10010124_41070 [Pilimelia terevasa]|uniref:Uncharacterized protein n=1 Tax=Pilimelia terevasa TaxID=53372 RepID=A0A8J3FKW4_9ACTN|nr:hypothetical protein [Pilimelia terevasa]GGK43982.1 hypothetical protein GCM10010124_41070 [Pilimelia terevasa]
MSATMPVELAPVVSATARWLSHAFPSPWPGAFSSALVELQARQAVTVAAWLRYPTTIDAELLTIAGPGGADHLDWIFGVAPGDDRDQWRTWVDEVAASWAGAILTDPLLAECAVACLGRRTGSRGLTSRFRRLLAPDEQDRQAAVLLRHPDLVASIADLHADELLRLLDGEIAALRH